MGRRCSLFKNPPVCVLRNVNNILKCHPLCDKSLNYLGVVH